ncbi:MULTISPECIES: hypothetical protein [Lysobacter]|uniref:Uncharacterized protein n=1 Tax=Lysobacter firmicutimachus TaxID=1792846 RepID=A0ABU8D072_9GAMM|nr:hypothetical protein [Lysobacter antibioticus]
MLNIGIAGNHDVGVFAGMEIDHNPMQLLEAEVGRIVGLQRVAEAAEYIQDAAPRPAEQADIARFNGVINAVSNAAGLEIPNMSVKIKAEGFQGVFRVDGRLDSQRLDRELDRRK